MPSSLLMSSGGGGGGVGAVGAGVTADLACREKWLAKPFFTVEPAKVA